MKIFISYKSEDVNVVRNVAERLVSCHIDIWFAEHVVLPANYDEFEKDIVVNLNRAVESCTHALVFTNDRWAESSYCRQEMKAILENIMTANIQEVCIPVEEQPHKDFPVLARLNPVIYDDDINKLIVDIGERLEVDITLAIDQNSWNWGREVNFQSFGVSLYTGPFEGLFVSRILSDMMQFQAWLNGVKVKLFLRIEPLNSVIDQMSVFESGNADDRKLYNQYLAYAKSWEVEQDLSIRGLHLFFSGADAGMRDGEITVGNLSSSINDSKPLLSLDHRRSYLSITYISKNYADGTRMWERFYVISSRGPTPREQGEIHLIFTAKLGGSDREQFERFCALTRYFDLVAGSVLYRLPNSRLAKANNVPIALIKGFYTIVPGWYLANSLQDNVSVERLLGMSAIFGYFLADILMFFLSPIYQRYLWYFTSNPYEDSYEDDAYTRFSSRLLHWLIANPFWLLGLIYADLRNSFRFEGTLWIPGPSLVWIGACALLIYHVIIPTIGLEIGVIFGILAGCLFGAIIILRCIGTLLNVSCWRDLLRLR